jgi:hypothetical protein
VGAFRSGDSSSWKYNVGSDTPPVRLQVSDIRLDHLLEGSRSVPVTETRLSTSAEMFLPGLTG